MDSQQKEIDELTAKNAELQSTVEKLQAQLAQKEAESDTDKKDATKLDSLEALQKQLADKDAEISKLKDEIAENSFVPVRAVPPGSRL